MTFVSDFEPRGLWAHFDRILEIPRGSKHEERARAYVLEVAKRNGAEAKTDAAGNVVVRKPASRGREGAATVILQSHLDMVQEKRSDVAHDFANDPILPRKDGDYLYATGTTLGSDNGIGVAAMLAALEAKDLTHGPLELLFTVDEETGLTGAAQLDPALLSGRRLLNLDSEEEGILYVGCAGGADTVMHLPLATETAPPKTATLATRVHGLKGGHSGVDIHLQRGNAIQVLARVVAAAGPAARIAALTGGGAHNAIPREATATLVVPADRRDAVVNAMRAELALAKEELRAADPGLEIEITSAPTAAAVWTAPVAARALDLLLALPHGVLAMSLDIPGLVETSNNLATVRTEGDRLMVYTSSRSSVDSALAATRRKVRAVATLAGASVQEKDGYPGWKPDMQSRLLAVMQDVCGRQTGAAPKVSAIHAGLECGIIGKKIPGVDMISFGPQIEFPHSPDERVRIPSVGRFWQLLAATLDELAKG